jgi:alpha-ketoglutaric semialdehyde dehydrogenase
MTASILRSFIGGEWRDGASRMPDLNPARPSEVLAEAELADASVAQEAVDAAEGAASDWAHMPAPARGEILRRAADLLDQRVEDVGRDLTREEGKTLAEGVGETKRAVAILRYFAGQTLEPDGETYPSHQPSTILFSRREPLGVVTAITPWNFPIAIPAWKIAPALAYGNVVVWKPADLVPLTSVHFASALVDAGLAPGVLNLVLGHGSEIGSVLTTNDAVHAITFTGSNEVGRQILLAGTERAKKIQLELGGKNPAVVFADADMDFAVEQVGRGAFMSAGQKCTATSRVIVERTVATEFSERLAALARSWKLGDPLEPDTRVGPLVSRAQFESVTEYLDTARADGATILAGGERVDGLEGYFVRPTVLTDLPSTSRVVREEIFGPITTVQVASTYEDALHLANDTPYGLTASLFTADLDRALRFARDIRAGVVKINDESAGVEFQVPFGGMKASSSGSREQGKVARDFFSQWKTVYVNPSAGGSA